MLKIFKAVERKKNHKAEKSEDSNRWNWSLFGLTIKPVPFDSLLSKEPCHETRINKISPLFTLLEPGFPNECVPLSRLKVATANSHVHAFFKDHKSCVDFRSAAHDNEAEPQKSFQNLDNYSLCS